MINGLLSRVPIVNSLYFFSWKAHKIALPKFFILWFLSSLPIIISVFMSDVPVGDGSLFFKFVSRLRSSFTPTDLFVYSAAFLTPLIYILIERYHRVESNEGFKDKVDEALKVFNGYGFNWFCSVFLLLLTAISFSSFNSVEDDFRQTFLYAFLSNWIFVIYTYSLYCWYLSILDGLPSLGGFVESNREEEKDISLGLSNRVRKLGGEL